MKLMTLHFEGFEEKEVIEMLHGPNSGFEINPRAPLRWDLGVSIAIAGLVLNSAQLAVGIYQLLLAKKSQNPGMKATVTIERPDGTVEKIEGTNVGEIEVKLEG
jgi:hypothetical protein